MEILQQKIALMAIETGIVAPYFLYILGLDELATSTSILILLTALFSQIPKRFIWCEKEKKILISHSPVSNYFYH